MSLEIYPIPTFAAMTRALNVANGGVALQGRYIQFGNGFQSLDIDDAGRSLTENLASPLGRVVVNYAERVSDVQWRLEVDIAGQVADDFNLSEIALLDEKEETIALWSSNDSALFSVSTQMDSVLISINLLFATLPANSLDILHQSFPIGVLTAKAAQLDEQIAALEQLKLDIEDELDSPRIRAIIGGIL